jgi:hypothetical protein
VNLLVPDPLPEPAGCGNSRPARPRATSATDIYLLLIILLALLGLLSLGYSLSAAAGALGVGGLLTVELRDRLAR